MKSLVSHTPLKALRVPFIINVLRAGFEAALLLLSIIHLLSIEHTPRLSGVKSDLKWLKKYHQSELWL